ncbi:MAG TPA: hypothetical protein VNN22_08850 [Verrucomicrobiae bacterium]|nr:hypothetical protein [Verrucomicrobiae bacterium]
MKPSTGKFVVPGVLLLLLLAGCQSGAFTHYISPQISGRVLAADTRQPLAGANVARIQPQPSESFVPPKGGQVLMQSTGVRTDADGRFLLAGESILAPFRQTGWWSVPVSFSCSGYEMFQRSYSGTNLASQSESGVPILDVGDVLLKPQAE